MQSVSIKENRSLTFNCLLSFIWEQESSKKGEVMMQSQTFFEPSYALPRALLGQAIHLAMITTLQNKALKHKIIQFLI